MGLQRQPVQKFRGLNTKVAPYDLEPGEAATLRNVRYPAVDPSVEAIEQRKGILPLVSGFTSFNSGGAGIEHGVSYLEGDGSVIVSAGKDIFRGGILSGSTSQFERLYDSALAPNTTDSDMGIGNWYFALVSLPTLGYPRVYCAPANSDTPQICDVFSSSSGWAITGTPAPSFFRSLVYWRGRMVAVTSDGNRVFYSNTGDPNTWGNFIDIFDEKGSENIELIVHKNNLYLLKRHSLWMIYDPNSFANRLIANEGSGTLHRHVMVSNPVDQRLYICNASNGYVYSTNGETDWVIENLNAPMSHLSFDVGTTHIRATYDPVSGSTLFLYGSTSRGDTIEEFPLFGKPGERPILRHRIPGAGAMFSGIIRSNSGATGSAWRPVLVGRLSGSVTQVLGELFGQIGKDDITDTGGTAIQSFWEGGWMPIISEEPWERIRRVSALVRGTMTVSVYSQMQTLDGASPNLTWSPTAYTGPTPTARQFQMKKGPNKKGRYHKLRVDGTSVAGEDWGLSSLEFALRGGKSKA